MITYRFTGEGIEAFHKASKFLRKLGYSIGPMQRGGPVAAMYGNYAVQKWRNLSDSEREETHVIIRSSSSSFRDGDAIVEFREHAPKFPDEII